MIIKAYSNVVARRHVVYIRLCDHDLVVVVAWWVPRRRRYLLGDINMKKGLLVVIRGYKFGIVPASVENFHQ